MKILKSISTFFVMIIALYLVSCSQDETMDEVIDNTEINHPSDPDDDGKEDPPSGDD